MAVALLMVPPLHLAFQLCIGLLHEDSWIHGDAFTTFYRGVGLLLLAFARRVCEIPAQQSLDTFETARDQSLAVTA